MCNYMCFHSSRTGHPVVSGKFICFLLLPLRFDNFFQIYIESSGPEITSCDPAGNSSLYTNSHSASAYLCALAASAFAYARAASASSSSAAGKKPITKKNLKPKPKSAKGSWQ